MGDCLFVCLFAVCLLVLFCCVVLFCFVCLADGTVLGLQILDMEGPCEVILLKILDLEGPWGFILVDLGVIGCPWARLEAPREALEGQKRSLHRFSATIRTQRAPFGGHFGAIFGQFARFLVSKCEVGLLTSFCDGLWAEK